MLKIKSKSDYAKILDLHIKERHMEKISMIGIGPVLISEQQFGPEGLPPVVLDTSYYTIMQFKAFQSLYTYKQTNGVWIYIKC